jgi:hypothetical protein
VPPTLVWPACCTLERGWWNPRKRYEHLYRALTRRRRDVKPVRRVSFVVIGPVPPSRALQHHPRRCGSQEDKTSPRPPLCDRQPSVSPTLELTHTQRPEERLPHCHPRSHSWTDTGHAVTLCQKQDSPGRSSTPWRCTLCRRTKLEQCDTIVNRLPLAYKRRERSPGRRGDDGRRTLTRPPPTHYIGTSPQSNLRDLEASPPLPSCL